MKLITCGHCGSKIQLITSNSGAQDEITVTIVPNE